MIGVLNADHMDYMTQAVTGMQTMWTPAVEPKLQCASLGMGPDIGRFFFHMALDFVIVPTLRRSTVPHEQQRSGIINRNRKSQSGKVWVCGSEKQKVSN